MTPTKASMATSSTLRCLPRHASTYVEKVYPVGKAAGLVGRERPSRALHHRARPGGASMLRDMIYTAWVTAVAGERPLRW